MSEPRDPRRRGPPPARPPPHRSRKVFVHTFGCQMNESDSDRMLELLGRHAFARADVAGGRRPHPPQHLRGPREGGAEAPLRARPLPRGEGAPRRAHRGVGLRRAAGEGAAPEARPVRGLRLRSGQHRAAPGDARARARARAVLRDRLDGVGGVRLPRRRSRGGARPGHRVRHRDEGLRQRLRVLHRPAHARARGVAAGRGGRRRVRRARRGRRARGDAHRAERELVRGRLRVPGAAPPRRGAARASSGSASRRATRTTSPTRSSRPSATSRR